MANKAAEEAIASGDFEGKAVGLMKIIVGLTVRGVGADKVGFLSVGVIPVWGTKRSQLLPVLAEPGKRSGGVAIVSKPGVKEVGKQLLHVLDNWDGEQAV